MKIFRLREGLLDVSKRVQYLQETFLKCCLVVDLVTKIKRQAIYWEEIFANKGSAKPLSPDYIKKF
jgi:membrane-anchored glycerophosphoryl diester phosphodiesterase (GDPDase)